MLVAVIFFLFLLIEMKFQAVFANNEKGMQAQTLLNNGLSVQLTKRNRWTIFGSRAAHNIVVAVGTISGGWWANNCPPMSQGCWIASAIVLVAAVAEAAIRTVSGSQSMNARSLPQFSYLEEMGYELNAVNATVTNYIRDRLNNAGLSLIGLTNLTATALVKRDLFNATAQSNLLIHWSSNLGTHVGSHAQQDWNKMIDDIVTDTNPGSLASTLRHTQVDRLQKRGGEFNVEWVSYNWDNPNSDLSEGAAQDRQLEEEEYDSYVYDWFNSNHGWKYCMSVEKNDHVGTADTYDDIGSENAYHGELYFNTYGGVDGYCNDNKDGAQCSQDGCE